MALATTLALKISANLTKAFDLAPLGGAVVAQAELAALLATGTGAGQADRVYSDNVSIGSGATVDLDLSGALVDAFGDACVFVKVKLLWIKSAAANTVDLTLFGDANSVPILNTAATTSTLKPGGVFMVYNPTGFAVTGATGDIIQVANGAATSTYDILVIGTSV